MGKYLDSKTRIIYDMYCLSEADITFLKSIKRENLHEFFNEQSVLHDFRVSLIYHNIKHNHKIGERYIQYN